MPWVRRRYEKMKRLKARKLLAWLLSISMIASAMLSGSAPYANAADDSDKETSHYARTINLGTKGISRPIVPTGSGQEWRGDHVWFGLGGGVTLHNRVLDPSTTEFGTDESMMLLENSYVLEDKKLHSEGLADWEEASTYLNGEFMDIHFSAGEKKAIAKSSKTKVSDQDGKGYSGLRFVPFSDVSIFLLDAKEVTRPSYGYNDNKNNKAVSRIKKENGQPASWWLRSECNVEYVDSSGMNCFQGGVVGEDGSIFCIADHPEEEDYTQGISPAYNVKTSAVVFTSMFSEAEAGENDTLFGKSFGIISGDKTLSEVTDYDTVDNIGHNWKLTLKSEDAAPQITDIKRIQNKLTFDYSGVRTGDRQTLSAIITSGEGDGEIILRYGTLAETDKAGSQSGTVTFTLPAGFDAKKHKLKVFSEQRNGAATTDYAGDMAVVDVPDGPVVTEPPVVTGTPTPVPTVTPVVKPAETDKPEPTETPAQTLKPTKRPDVETDVVTTAKPTKTPEGTGKPTSEPTEKPTQEPKETEQPVETGTPVPNTEKPTEKPEKTEQPSEEPTDKPEETDKPDTTAEPTQQPEVSKSPAPQSATATPPAKVIEDPDLDEEEESGSERTKTGTTSGTKDQEPKTGEGSKVEMYATIAMVAGLSYLLLYFTDEERGMTEERKKELVSRLVRWAKKGGRFRNMLAAAAIVLLLVYYHAIGKRSLLEKNVCQDET